MRETATRLLHAVAPHLRSVVLAVLTACAYLLVAAGFATFHRGAGLIAGGVLLGLWAWQAIGDDA